MAFPEPVSSPTNSPMEAHLPPSALEFEEFSFWGEDGSLGLRNATHEQSKALENYLHKNYGAVTFQYSGPFLILGCEKELPPENERPFTICGLIAMWRPVDDDHFEPLAGYIGGADPVAIDPGMLAKIKEREIPPDEVFLYLAEDVFPDCIALSMMWDNLVVELPETNWDDFINRVKGLPSDIMNAPTLLLFHNGCLPNTERRRREQKPDPKVEDSHIYDETDYVDTDGKFYPGSIISSVSKKGGIVSSVTAGILIQKGDDQRLTCSFHNWQKHYDTYPNKFGQSDNEAQRIFKVSQGIVSGDEAGTTVGFVRERIGETDIALAQLDRNIVFENSFMEMDISPKIFVRSEDQTLGDKYLIDAFSTGKQELFGYGARREIGRLARRTRQNFVIPPGHEHLLPNERVVYIKLKQGIFATNHPVINTKPQIRDRVCGAVLLKCANKDRRSESEKTVMERGEIVGMMHYADLQSRNASTVNDFLIYADSFDPLIDDGWSIVQNQGVEGNNKKKEEVEPEGEEEKEEVKPEGEEEKGEVELDDEEENGEDELDDEEENVEFSDESPTKKRKTD